MATKQLSLFWRPEEERPAMVKTEVPEKSPTSEEDYMIELLRAADECGKCHVKPVFYVSKNHKSIQGYTFDYIGMKCPLCGFSCGGAGGEDMETVRHWNDCNRSFNR